MNPLVILTTIIEIPDEDAYICGDNGCGAVDAEMPFYFYLVLALSAVALLLLIWTSIKFLRRRRPRRRV